MTNVLVLTVVKNAADLAATYLENLRRLTFPHRQISVGILESDSSDSSEAAFRMVADKLSKQFRRAGFWKRNFGFQIPDGTPRWLPSLQARRREILAKSRNHLLFRALGDEDWVLWIDVDVIDYPDDLIEQLLSYEKSILQPNCVLEYGGRSFDRNAWRDQGRYHLDSLREEGALVRLDSVGGTVLLVNANLHRDGLVFPPFFYGDRNQRARQKKEDIETDKFGEIETEGLAMMAADMGVDCFGLPHLEVKHRNK